MVPPVSLLDPGLSALVPRALRGRVGALWTVDRELGRAAARTTGEPMLGRIRLQWWRDELARPSVESDAPAVRALGRRSAKLDASLAALIDAWDTFCAEDRVASVAAIAFARARGGALFAATSGLLNRSDECDGGERWALVDLAANLSDRDLAATLFAAARDSRCTAPRTPCLRAIDAVAAAVAKRNGNRRYLLEQLIVLRVGVAGR